MLALALLLAATAPAEVVVLCYHDVPREVAADDHGTDVRTFISHLEWLLDHGFTFVTPQHAAAAFAGATSAPPRSVLLTFDDGYVSFREQVLPVLERYGIPSLLALPTAWLETGAPPDLPAPLMTWSQLQDVARSPLVTIASHSHNLHRAALYNPQGNPAPVAGNRLYADGRYETDEVFVARVRGDLEEGRRVLRERLGVEADLLVWPYGAYNELGVEAARAAGFAGAFVLSEESFRQRVWDAFHMPRLIVTMNPDVADFAGEIRKMLDCHPRPAAIRAVQADLDYIWDPDPGQTEANLGRFLDRIVAMQVNTVFLQAFCDADGDGLASSVYFPNRWMPVRMDLLNRVSNQLTVRGYRVFVWMPALSLAFPGTMEAPERWTQAWQDGAAGVATSGYCRVSLFDPGQRDAVKGLYADLAAQVRFAGVLFQDDAVLSDAEPVEPAAAAACLRDLGFDPRGPRTAAQEEAWMHWKARLLDDWIDALAGEVRRYRPEALFARNLYAGAVADPASLRWLAQSFTQTLARVDYAVIMAYPEMEKARDPVRWLESLADAVAAVPGALDRTVFKLQTKDWSTGRWVDGEELDHRLRRLQVHGAWHLAYYPDDYTRNQPPLDVLRREMSTRTVLFDKPRVKRPATAPPSVYQLPKPE